jgi:hypothetical protein
MIANAFNNEFKQGLNMLGNESAFCPNGTAASDVANIGQCVWQVMKSGAVDFLTPGAYNLTPHTKVVSDVVGNVFIPVYLVIILDTTSSPFTDQQPNVFCNVLKSPPITPPFNNITVSCAPGQGMISVPAQGTANFAINTSDNYYSFGIDLEGHADGPVTGRVSLFGFSTVGS